MSGGLRDRYDGISRSSIIIPFVVELTYGVYNRFFIPSRYNDIGRDWYNNNDIGDIWVMPTAKQSWLKRFPTYYAATEENKRQFSKRIKQLTIMLKDESFLEYLSNAEYKDYILEFLFGSGLFDDYIMVSEYDVPYIQDNDFGLISYMKTMVGAFQSEHYMLESNMRKQSKIYIEFYIQHLERRRNYDIAQMKELLPNELPF